MPSQASPNPRPSFPIEICEQVIDAIFPICSDIGVDVLRSSLQTLRNCALVCRAWRFRPRMWLFHTLMIEDYNALHRLATLLKQRPALAQHVSRLWISPQAIFEDPTVEDEYKHKPMIGCSLHDPVAILPVVLGGILPSMTHLKIDYRLPSDAERRDLERARLAAELPYPPEGIVAVPHVPFRRFALGSWKSFPGVTKLELRHVRFANFLDFARMLSYFSAMKSLTCIRVQWSVFGNPLTQCPGKTFLKELKDIKVWKRPKPKVGALQRLIRRIFTTGGRDGYSWSTTDTCSSSARRAEEAFYMSVQ